MACIFIRYRLQPGTRPEDFERWVRETDHPQMRALRRVGRFDTFRVGARLFDEAEPTSHYVELFEIDDLDGFLDEDVPGETVQGVMGDFTGLVEAPEFLVCEPIDPA